MVSDESFFSIIMHLSLKFSENLKSASLKQEVVCKNIKWLKIKMNDIFLCKYNILFFVVRLITAKQLKKEETIEDNTFTIKFLPNSTLDTEIQHPSEIKLKEIDSNDTEIDISTSDIIKSTDLIKCPLIKSNEVKKEFEKKAL